MTKKKDEIYEILKNIPKEGIREEQINKCINNETILKLIMDNYLIKTFSDDGTIYNDTPIIKLTKKGKVKVFMQKYDAEIQKFKSKLLINGYDIDLIEEFLQISDLDLSPKEILTIENFYFFCMEYDRALEKDSEVKKKKK